MRLIELMKGKVDIKEDSRLYIKSTRVFRYLLFFFNQNKNIYFEVQPCMSFVDGTNMRGLNRD